MSSSRKARHWFRLKAYVASAIAIVAAAVIADSASAQTARQRATFTVQGNTVIGLVGLTTGILNDDNPTSSKLLNVQLSPQSIGGFQVGYTGTVTADISFDTTTHTITGIHVANANLVAGNSASWVPGNWDPMKYPNGKDWDPGETVPQGQLGGFPTNGTETEPANYGGTVAGLINFATRNVSLGMTNGGTVFPVAPGGNFTVTTANKARFLTGQNALYSAIDGGDLAESNDELTSYDGFEVDLGAVQPAMFTYYDDMGMNPQMLPNPLAGQAYPSGVVWRYMLTNTNVPVYDAAHNPILDGNMNQITTNIRTYGDLAPGFETTKGGLQAGTNPPNVDKDWFNPDDGTVLKPNTVRTYIDSDVWFDIAGNPLKVRADLDLPNPGVNWANPNGTGAVSSSITATLNGGTGKYDANLAMNMDATAAFFVGDFAVSLKLGQALNIFEEYVPGTGRIFADVALSLKAGDVNNDGLVNIFDINMVSANWSPKPHADLYAGDANNDGVVNIFDINNISSNWAPGGATAVPEPSTFLLAALGGVAVFLGYRRSR